jgi:DNA-binding response OmpR family regulator
MGALLLENLRAAGYEVVLTADGADARRLFATTHFDLCILDVMLPTKDGFQLAQEIRELDPQAVFMFLTARNTLHDKSTGFKAGCDDYITKPFELEELHLRINAILERTHGPRLLRDPVLRFGAFSLDLRERSLTIGRKRSVLTEKEARLLHVLVLHLDTTITRSELLNRVWGKDDPYHGKSMDVYLTRIRKYLRNDPGIALQNIHGHGYRLVTTAA